ncbi:hypothetical protein QBC43DRAFT_367615 [Cladorrhinum sp. PSN259]|nr:hypothetical protein QBC43DRAFT_367615 [Cladorrhinum sp. PSN259]
MSTTGAWVSSWYPFVTLASTENCDQVRRKANRFIDSGAMTKTGFAKEIAISAKSLNGFLGCDGTIKGNNFAAFRASWAYLRKSELGGSHCRPPRSRRRLLLPLPQQRQQPQQQ